MDLETRKYNFIRELIAIDKENEMTELERVLKHVKERQSKISDANSTELDNRLEKYQNSPDDVLKWNDVKNDY